MSREMPDVPPPLEDRPPGRRVTLVDVPVPSPISPAARRLALAVGVMAFFIAALSAAAAWPPVMIIISAALALVVMLLIFGPLIQGPRERRQMTAMIQDAGGLTVDLAEALYRRARRSWFTTSLRSLARVLAGSGHTGTVVRYGEAGLLTPVRGVGVAFEPRLLAEDDESFRDLVTTLTHADREQTLLSETSVRESARRARLRRILLVIAMVAAVVYGVLMLLGMARFSDPWGLLILAIFFGSSRHSEGRLALDWYAVPGGLAVKPPSSATVTYFPSDTSALVMRPESRHGWRIIVSNGERTLERIVTLIEAEALLACWLSPLDPPSRESVVQALVSDGGQP